MPFRIRPVPLDLPLAEVVRRARRGAPLGIWVRQSVGAEAEEIQLSSRQSHLSLLAGPDLGALLWIAPRVLAWDGFALRALPGCDLPSALTAPRRVV